VVNINTPEQVRALVRDLGTSTWTLAAIAVAFASGLAEELRQPHSVAELTTACPGLPPERVARCIEVLAAVGLVVEGEGRYHLAPGVVPLVEEHRRGAFLGEMRSTLVQATTMVDAAVRGDAERGWRHVDPVLLEAQGALSSGFPPIFKAELVPSMGDLGERLQRPGACFLDVGVGVGALAIAMCRTWPNLAVVGIDPYDVPLALARQNVDRAGLDGRIALRRVAVQDLTDESSFELAWIPIVFIPAPAVDLAVARVRRALKEGAWIILPVMGEAGDERQRAVSALQNELRGGALLKASDLEAILHNAGFAEIRTFAGPPTLTIGRRS
jgi:SAM-dependent methyltransferase